MDRNQLEKRIAARSHQTWEGKPSGRDRDYWARARAEIEAEWRTALYDETSPIVPSQLPISQRPTRHHA